MKFTKVVKSNKYSVEYSKPGDELSDFIGYLTVEAYSPEDALLIAQEKRPNGSKFKIVDKFYEPVEYVTKDSEIVYNQKHDKYYWESVKSAEQPTTPKPTTTLPDNMMYAWDPRANQWIIVMKDNPVVTPPTYNPNNVNNLNNTTTTQMYTPIKSTLIDSLNQFLDGDKYLREIKIEKGLISDGLIKFAGINPIKGPKYSITDKGLQLLKQAAQEEYDFENDYVKARKSYLLDGITESEFQTGSPQSQGQMPKFSIFEKDGSELAQIQANNETDAKVKFIMENPEYEGSQTISVKKIDSTYSETTTQGLDFPNQSVSPSTDVKVDPKGWVNMAADENKENDFNDETKDIKSFLKRKAVKLTPKLLKLGNILSSYMNPNLIDVSILDENKGMISARGEASIINDLEHEIKDIGIYCSTETLPVDKNKGIYTLNITLE